MEMYKTNTVLTPIVTQSYVSSDDYKKYGFERSRLNAFILKNEKKLLFKSNKNIALPIFSETICIKNFPTSYNTNSYIVKEYAVKAGSILMHSSNTLFRKNIEKLNMMVNLDDNWDQEGASKFDLALIANVKELLRKFGQFQPNIFPTSNSDIQAEFYIQNNYLELLLSKTKCEVYITDGKNLANDIFEDFDYDESKILSIVQKFHAQNKYGDKE